MPARLARTSLTSGVKSSRFLSERLVILLHREDYYHDREEGYTPTGITELIIAKQRNGPTGTVPLVLRSECTRFEPAAPESWLP